MLNYGMVCHRSGVGHLGIGFIVSVLCYIHIVRSRVLPGGIHVVLEPVRLGHWLVVGLARSVFSVDLIERLFRG